MTDLEQAIASLTPRQARMVLIYIGHSQQAEVMQAIRAVTTITSTDNA